MNRFLYEHPSNFNTQESYFYNSFPYDHEFRLDNITKSQWMRELPLKV